MALLDRPPEFDDPLEVDQVDGESTPKIQGCHDCRQPARRCKCDHYLGRSRNWYE